jgi:hypothetical protein
MLHPTVIARGARAGISVIYRNGTGGSLDSHGIEGRVRSILSPEGGYFNQHSPKFASGPRFSQ